MIEDYSFGRITIDGKRYTADVIVYPDRVDGSWWRKEGHTLSMDDLRDAVAERPEVLVVGTGAYGLVRVPEVVRKALAELGIQLSAAKTDEACKTYNEIAPKKKTVAALHLTC